MIALEQERRLLQSLLETAKEFYSDANNVQAFEAWKKNKEANKK